LKGTYEQYRGFEALTQPTTYAALPLNRQQSDVFNVLDLKHEKSKDQETETSLQTGVSTHTLQ